MDRSSRAADKVKVYATPEAKCAGQVQRILQLVPYPLYGLDNYLVDGVMYQGYRDGEDACVFLDHPHPMLGRPQSKT